LDVKTCQSGVALIQYKAPARFYITESSTGSPSGVGRFSFTIVLPSGKSCAPGFIAAAASALNQATTYVLPCALERTACCAYLGNFCHDR
jgi:hypothetical protein